MKKLQVKSIKNQTLNPCHDDVGSRLQYQNVTTATGHSKISTTLDTYSHLTNKLENQSIERFDSFFEQKTATKPKEMVANTKNDGGKQISGDNFRHLRIIKTQ